MELHGLVDPGRPTDGEIELELMWVNPPEPEKNHVPSYRFHVRLCRTGEEVGEIRLRIGDTEDIVTYGGHIGYGVHEQHRGHSYATKAIRLLKSVARANGMKRLIVCCDPDNKPSVRSILRAGGVFVDFMTLEENHPFRADGITRRNRYRIDI